MYGQWLQAQLSSRAGAGINVLSGARFCIWWKMPSSVAMMNVCAGDFDGALDDARSSTR